MVNDKSITLNELVIQKLFGIYKKKDKKKWENFKCTHTEINTHIEVQTDR